MLDKAVSLHEAERQQKRKCVNVFVLILVAFFSLQFGHGSNIGVAISLPGDSKAENFLLGSWVMVGVCCGLPITPWVCRRFGSFRVCSICVVIDLVVILFVLWPEMTMHQFYAVRFAVGFFEAPILPYLQLWLARFGKHTWNLWNTLLHALVPVGECAGYVLTQELVLLGFAWQWAFLGQALLLCVAVLVLWAYAGHEYLDLERGAGGDPRYSHIDDDSTPRPVADSMSDSSSADAILEASSDSASEVVYPESEHWCVFWATNVALAAQLGFFSGCKYVIRDYTVSQGCSDHFVVVCFSAIYLFGPSLGGTFAMSNAIVRPDQWGQVKKTLKFLICVSGTAAVVATLLLVISGTGPVFWPLLFITYAFAGGVYPAAQGIINIALTSRRVIQASVYQVQCNNILFAMPLPYVLGKSMDVWGVNVTFKGVVMTQALAAVGFIFALATSCTTEDRQISISAKRGRFRGSTEPPDCSETLCAE